MTCLFFFVVSDQRDIKGQGSGVLEFGANIGEVVRFSMISEYSNFQNTSLLYKTEHLSGQKVLSDSRVMVLPKKTMRLNSRGEQCGYFPAKLESQTYEFVTCDVVGYGTENYTVLFAVYESVPGKGTELFGFFKWDPKITVKE